MNFLNSYTSTFNPYLKDKKKILKLFFLCIILSYSAAFILNRRGFKITKNDIILEHKLKKINDIGFSKVNTIFIGDSSGRNAIDSEFFNSISKLNSKNLSLTGSFGISGSVGILKKAFKKFKFEKYNNHSFFRNLGKIF